jgi:hypothetical protein
MLSTNPRCSNSGKGTSICREIMALKVTIKLSAINCVRLAYGCPIGSRTYGTLSKGSFVRRQKSDTMKRVFEIVCDLEEAQRFITTRWVSTPTQPSKL